MGHLYNTREEDPTVVTEVELPATLVIKASQGDLDLENTTRWRFLQVSVE